MLRTDTLKHLLEDALAAGFARIGQVLIRAEDGGYSLLHAGDASRSDLEVFSGSTHAIAIARNDGSGTYRPLKSSPNLRRGWLLRVGSLSELQLALDALYPAALANWRALLRGELPGVPMRETVNRQTGMYRITGKITDGQAEGLVKDLCSAECLRKRIWGISACGPAPQHEAPEIPLLCDEACNLFVAAARKVVKGIPRGQAE